MNLSSLLYRWWVTSRGDGPRAATAAVAPLPPPDLEAVRQAMRDVVQPCSDEHRARAAGQIARASSAVELWLLRASLYQYLAQDLGQAEAGRRMEHVLALFDADVPGSVRWTGIEDNAMHAERIH